MRNFEPHITVRAVQPVIAALEALGHQVDGILAEAKISRAMLQHADGRVPHSAMMLFWQRARIITGDDQLGIHLAEAVPIQSFEVHSYALLSSSTLREAYRRACRYQRLIHEATDLTFEEETTKACCATHYLADDPRRDIPPRRLSQFKNNAIGKVFHQLKEQGQA